MAQTNFTSFFLGPFAVYTSPSGAADVQTGVPYLGTDLREGDYCDLSPMEAAQWNVQYGSNLFAGRYRLVRLSTGATAAHLGFGYPVGIAIPSSVAQVVVSAAGAGYTAGTYTCAASAGGVMASVVVNASGAISSAQLLNPGSGLTSTPTFSLSELSGGSNGSVLAQMAVSSNVVTSFDSNAIDLSDVRGVALCAPTSAQITAGAWIVIEEAPGIAPVYVTTATSTTVGAICTSATAGAVTTTVNSGSPSAGFMGYAIDLPAGSTVIRCLLRTAVYPG